MKTAFLSAEGTRMEDPRVRCGGQPIVAKLEYNVRNVTEVDILEIPEVCLFSGDCGRSDVGGSSPQAGLQRLPEQNGRSLAEQQSATPPESRH